MRINELLNEFAPPTESNDIEQLLSLANDPATSAKIKNQILSIFQAVAIQMVEPLEPPAAVEPAAVEPAPQAPAPQAPAAVEPPRQEVPMSEDARTVSKTQAKKMVEMDPEFAAGLLTQMAAGDPKLAQALAIIKAQEHAQGKQEGEKNYDAVFENIKTDIHKKVQALHQIPKEIQNSLETALVGVVYHKVAKAEIMFQFLEDCASDSTKPIDLPAMVASGGSGQLVDGSNPYFQILAELAKLNPGSGNAASGQGEWMLVLAGKNTKKIHPGDIAIAQGQGDLKIEVKASSTKEGKSKLSDFVLSCGKLDVKRAKEIMHNRTEEILGTPRTVPALNPKNIALLNPEVFIPMNAKIKGSVQKMFLDMYTAIAPEPSMQPYIDSIIKEILPTGEIDLDKMYGPVATLAAKHYQLINKHNSLLLLNIPTLGYSVVTDPKEMLALMGHEQLITMSSIFDFRPNPSALATFTKIVAKSRKKKELQLALEHVDSLICKYF